MAILTLDMIDLVSVTEAAKYLGISRQAVITAIVEGRLAATRVGHQWTIRRTELEKYQVSEVRKRVGLRHKSRKPKRE